MCTGTISVGSVSVSGTVAAGGNNGGFVAGGGVIGGGAASTNSFFVPATTTLNDLISQQGVVPGTTMIPNAFYGGFAPLATPFANEQVCTSAYSSCQTEFAKCTSALGVLPNNVPGGAGFGGVTVSAGGFGGVTVPGTSLSLGAAQASATAICQSISQQVCQNLQLASCNALATGVRSVVGAGAAAACPTPWPQAAVVGVGVGVGLLLGVAEQVVVH